MTASPEALALIRRAARAADDKQATDIVGLDVSDQLAVTDAFLLCSASNDRQVRAIVDAIEASLDEIDRDPVRREGEKSGRWILLDYLDIVVHVQHTEERAFYDLERLWKDCPRIDLELPEPGERAGAEGARAAGELADGSAATDA